MRASTPQGQPLEPSSTVLFGTLGNDHLFGGPDDDTIEALDGKDMLRGLEGNDLLRGGLGKDRIWGGDGDDWLTGQPLDMFGSLRTELNVMRGGAGNDVYVVNGPGDRVIEKAGEGTDTVHTSIGFTLPDHVENLTAYYLFLIDGQPLVGNALDNHITASPFGHDTVYGLDGNDTLDGGARAGAYLDGGNGDDVLIQPFGESRGGAGADLFVAGGRGAMTAPDAPIAVLDFNAAEGDRLHIEHATLLDAADLFESGQLRFDAAQNQLVLDFDPSTTGPLSVDQVFDLPEVTVFDLQWITIGPLA